MLRMLLILACIAGAAPAHAQLSDSLVSGGQLSGEWRGVGWQVDPGGTQSSWTISMRVAAGSAAIDYPSLGCRARLHEVRRHADEIEFREEITQGPCIDRGRLVVRPMDGRLWWYWHDAQGRADASAVLYRAEDPIG
ncbi:MAG TPA: hypothetical protein VFV70_08780 [Hyphomonadaceae bacterium]|nr:hypothetical protein [Hyphomonadaceae bacterium]